MAEIKITFDLTFSRRFITAVSAFAVMLCAVPELDSESVTLSTYYPAPSGVYTNMITTGNTFLARDTGNVGIGNSAPGAKLDVSGIARMQQMTTTGANALNTANPYAADILIGSDYGTRHDGSIMMWNAAGALRLQSSADVLYLNTWNQALGTYNVALAAGTGATSTFNGPLTMNAKVTVNDTVKVSAVIQSTQGSVCSGPFTNTYGSLAGGTMTLCAGEYVTATDGIYTKYTIIPVVPAAATNPQVTYRCCPCPSGGCSGM